MKKVILLCGVLFVSINNLQAQFVLTPNGLKCENDNNYIIIEIENKTKEELFDNAHLFATSSFVSPHDVISVSGKEQITLNGVVSGIEWKSILKQQCSVNFTITMLFKDNRIRIDVPSINKIYTSGAELFLVQPNVMVSDGIFKKNGKIYSPQTKNGIERFFNKFVIDLEQYIVQNKHSDW